MMKSILIASVFSIAAFSTPVYADKGSLKQCQSLAKQMERIEAKRKKGGSGKQMDAWRKKRHKLSDKYYRLNCRRHGIL